MLADISSVDAIYIVCGRTDMRKSIDGLCAIIQEQFSMEIDHALFLFCGRKCDRIKAILKEADGIVMDYTQPSVQGMLYINQLFHLEDVIRSKYSSFDAIKKARLEKEKLVVEGFLSWLDQQSPTRGSRMDKAVTYI